jgi:uncharacterized protein (DUF4415 family)
MAGRRSELGREGEARASGAPAPPHAALDEDVIDWFRSQDRHYRARINAILRAYMARHRV